MQRSQQRKISELNNRYTAEQELLLEHKARRKRGLVRRLSALGLFVAIAITFTVYTLHTQNNVLEKKLEEKKLLEERLAELQMVERDLKDEIMKLNDDEYISEIARRDYYLSKPGETIFKVTSSTSD